MYRYRNRAVLEPRWNRDYIERIEIVMKEKEDVAGREINLFLFLEVGHFKAPAVPLVYHVK